MAWMVSNRVVQVTCDDCAVPAQRSGKIIRWPSLARALSELFGRRWGWFATRDLQLCGRCLARRVCQARGHSWRAASDRQGTRSAGVCCGRCLVPRPAASRPKPDRVGSR